MRATIQGNYIGQQRGKSKEGKDYDFVEVLSGNEVLRISGYNPGAAVKHLDKVQILCDIRRAPEAGYYINLVKD